MSPTPSPRPPQGNENPGQAISEAHLVTEAVTQLRRALRASVRPDIPWETLPMAQVELLQSLADISPARVGDLAERLHLASSTISGLVAQMMTAGLVQRDTDPADRRAAVVTLTKQGRARLAQWDQVHERRIGHAYDQLPALDRRAISRALPALGRLTRLLSAPDEQQREL